MAYDSFPSIEPEYDGAKKSVEARVLQSQFGDGYSQRAPDGLNSLPETWELVWLVQLSNRNSIVNFLKGKLGATAFLWTPPLASAAIKCICRRWSEVAMFGDWWRIEATFEQVFDL